ncbi:hypothetical protein WA026_018554 [Henosepilachna vigintioctopunctata]|uniref:Regulation of nuclear pre-mRNA domain-containing protein 2 n=1 Tax=Henosepilachna vigintioctopunctata TaxID=420089 RepID=A0AAW1U3E3_9CUCU
MNTTETEDFNVIQFEKKLTALKDSQESINNCCQWCLTNRQYHKKIVNSWLNVLKRVKVEHRLILFYLANDVIQYSKRRRYEYVESWGTALQKATTLVRDDKVKQKILRIFKIWEDRGVYNEEFISDLCGLISVTPTAPKSDEPHEFRATYVINKIRVCSNLETDTDLKLKKLKELNPKILETDAYYSSIKDRAHLDDTEKEIDTYAKHMEDYINALKAEVKNRINLISVLKQAEGQLDTDRKDVKIVANAYKSFGTRVKTFQKKLDEHKANLVSPIPSPDINAPSPNSDSDIDLPDGIATVSQDSSQGATTAQHPELDLATVQITNANYYNPVPAPTTDSGAQFVANGFTSFLGSTLPFNVQNFDTTSSMFSGNSSSISQTTNSNYGSLTSVLPPFSQTTSAQQQIPGLGHPPPPPKTNQYPYASDAHATPLQPPPMPPFGAKEDSGFGTATATYETSYEIEAIPDYGPPSFNANSSYTGDTSFVPTYSTASADTSYDPLTTLFVPTEGTFEPPHGANPYPPSGDEYNPEEELQTWEGDVSWTQPPPLDNADTPESPPPFEKEAYVDPIEYHDTLATGGATDIDHRVLPANLGATDKLLGRGKDVDHRNLISLIGSPATDSNSNQPSGSDVWTGDQDYRNPTNPVGQVGGGDRDYRLPFDIEQQLKLPPPPPPPVAANANAACPIPVLSTTNHLKKHSSYHHQQDNVESIDMDLSDDDAVVFVDATDGFPGKRDNLRVVVDEATSPAGSNSNNVHSIHSPDNFRSQSNSQDGLSSLPLSDLDHNFTHPTASTLLEPPPPLPELPDDAEENLFLDQMSNDINDFLLNPDELDDNLWNNAPPTGDLPPPNHLQPPPIFPNMTALPPPPMVPPPSWMGEPPPPSFHPQFNSGPPFQGPREKGNKRGKFLNNNNRGGRGGSFADNNGFGNRGGFSDNNNFNNRGGFNDNGQFDNRFNDSNYFNNRGGGNGFRGRGNRGNQRHLRGGFRGSFRGNRGGGF